MLLQLMCKDDIRAEFSIHRNDRGDYSIRDVMIHNMLPPGVDKSDLLFWVLNRNTGLKRGNLHVYISSINCLSLAKQIELTHLVSLTDCFWVRMYPDKVTWLEISPYSNDFDENIAVNALCGNGTIGIKYKGVTPELSTNGNSDKCWVRGKDNVYLYKRGLVVSRHTCLDPYNEVLASQVYAALDAGISYELTEYYGHKVSKCKLFTTEDLSFARILPPNINDAMRCCESISRDAGDRFKALMIADVLTEKSKAFYKKYGVLYNSVTNEVIDLAPGYNYVNTFVPFQVGENFDTLIRNVKSDQSAPENWKSYEELAYYCMTKDLHEKLKNLRDVELNVTCDKVFTKLQLEYVNTVFHTRLDRLLKCVE